MPASEKLPGFIGKLEAAIAPWRVAIENEQRKLLDLRAEFSTNPSWNDEQAYGQRVAERRQMLDSYKVLLADAVMSVYADDEAERSRNRAANAKHNHPNLPGRCSPACPEYRR